MKKTLATFILISAGSLLYAFLFWREQMGLNTLLFSSFAVGAAWWRWPENRRRRLVQLAMAATLLTAVLTVWHHSFLAKTMHVFSFLLMIGLLQEEEIRFVVFGLGLGLINLLEAPIGLFRNIRESLPEKSHWNTVMRWSQLSLIPLGLGMVFATIYYHANPKFAEMLDYLWDKLTFYIHWSWNLGQAWALIRGILVMGALLGASRLAIVAFRLEKIIPEDLLRLRKKGWAAIRGMIALKQEYRAGMIAFGILNTLLFLLNLADLRYVWVAYGQASPQELSQYVHEGTFLLLFSILLAIGAVLWYFRGNINFYPRNEGLPALVYVWLAQNAMLALSVGLRNWQYVAHYGLAYKRLGVFWFLLLVLFGLFSMYRKVRYQKSLSYLLRINSLAWFCSLLLASSINWDLAITRYNLRWPAAEGIDVQFLLKEVSDKNLFLLYDNQERLMAYSTIGQAALSAGLADKRHRFEMRTLLNDWPSWNYADARNEKYLAHSSSLLK